MSPIARALTRVLLEHNGEVCVGHPFRPPIIDRCVIAYGDLCRRAGYPAIERNVGRYLQEVAVCCAERGWPPLNSLAVNQETHMPGDNYDVAPGCSLLGWPGEAERCITFGGYPAAGP
jgi:hypothetical protein